MERIFKIRELPKWAKTKQWIEDSWDKSFEVLTFKKMDWMYWQWFTDDWQMVNFNAEFVKDWDFYNIINNNAKRNAHNNI